MRCALSNVTIAVVVSVLVAPLLIGCSQLGISLSATAPPEYARAEIAVPVGAAGEEQLTADQQAAARQVQRLTEAIGQGAAATATATQTVRWVEPIQQSEPKQRVRTYRSTPPAAPVESHVPGSALTSATIDDAPAVEVQPAISIELNPTTKQSSRPAADRAKLVTQLMQHISDGDAPDGVKAYHAAALSLIDPQRQLPSTWLDRFDARQRKLFQQYRNLLDEIAKRIGSEGNTVDSAAIARRLDGLFEDRALIIRRLELCRRVDGYGVYEPFGSSRFVVGRQQRMIVYIELDHFKIVRTGDGRWHEVRLTQEISLYNDSDGLRVWRLSPEMIRDVSRNPRRDFYTVKVIQLPDLGVGKYRLKVRMTDLNGNTEAESAADIHFVADGTLATGDDE